MTRILIVGAGGLGGALAGILRDSGMEVLVERPGVLDAVKSFGLAAELLRDIERDMARVRIVTGPAFPAPANLPKRSSWQVQARTGRRPREVRTRRGR